MAAPEQVIDRASACVAVPKPMMRNAIRLSLPLCLLTGLAACGEDGTAVRAGTQPLEKLVTPEARRRALATAAPAATTGDQARGMCGEVLRVSEQGRLILDRSNPSRLVVSAAIWQRVPQEARQAIVRCAAALRPASAGSGPVEVVIGGGESG